MKVQAKRVLEIDGLGVFKKDSEWNGFTKYNQIGGSNSFISISDTNGYMVDFFPTDDKEINIVSASPDIAVKLQELKSAKQ